MKKLMKFAIALLFVSSLSIGIGHSVAIKPGVYCVGCGYPNRLCMVYRPDYQECEESQVLWNCCGTAIIPGPPQ